MKNNNSATAVLKRPSAKRINVVSDSFAPYTPLSFPEIEQKAKAFAELIERKREQLADILLEYESFEVVEDETARTLDLLKNLEENSKYFQLRVNEVTAFLPRNQPLYAFSCFVIVPSLMASKVHFRIPQSMRDFFPKLLTLLEVRRQFPNIYVSNLERLEFLRERSALRVNPATGESIPVTDAVIFTGNSVHAQQLRVVFDDRTLFVTNGAGHNPVVVSKDANLSLAAESALDLQLYNQGQDCSAPNAILVQKDVYSKFLELLREKIKHVKIGQYKDRSCRIGPISDPKDLIRVQDFLIHHQKLLDPATPGIIRAREGIIEPTLVCKPLKDGGNFTEIFAPVFVVQQYDRDQDLSLYFEDPQYAKHAMFITLYGTSTYVTHLIGRKIQGNVLQDRASILRNTHPHAKGVEQGTRAYGGYGAWTSGLSINGKTICKPTLPQRDIYEWLVKPLLGKKSLEEYRKNLQNYTQVTSKNVEKLLRMISHGPASPQSAAVATGLTYVDMFAVKKVPEQRYAFIDEKNTYHLLEKPNIEYIAKLQPADIEMIRGLRKLLSRRSAASLEEFNTLLYALAVKPGTREEENRERQLTFFQHVYQLLLGTKSGPRLPQFLSDVDAKKVRELLDV